VPYAAKFIADSSWAARLGAVGTTKPLGKSEGEQMAQTKHFGPLAAAAGALVAVTSLVLVLVLVNPQPAGAAFPGANGKIAFSSDRTTTNKLVPQHRRLRSGHNQ
jgi:hypothetical protein